jgi:hypothetical protein
VGVLPNNFLVQMEWQISLAKCRWEVLLLLLVPVESHLALHQQRELKESMPQLDSKGQDHQLNSSLLHLTVRDHHLVKHLFSNLGNSSNSLLLDLLDSNLPCSLCNLLNLDSNHQGLNLLWVKWDKWVRWVSNPYHLINSSKLSMAEASINRGKD